MEARESTLCGPAFLRIDPDGTDEMTFYALTATSNTGSTASGADFDWNGGDEGDPVQEIGCSDLHDYVRLDGEIAYDNGNDTNFIAEPWPVFSSLPNA